MTKEEKKIFIETVERLFDKYQPEVPLEGIKAFKSYCETASVSEITEKGKVVLKALEGTEDWVSAKNIGNKIDVPSKSVTGALIKLVNDGYVEKQKGVPTVYRLTQKGIEYNLNNE